MKRQTTYMVIMEAVSFKTDNAMTALLMSNLELWIIKHDTVNLIHLRQTKEEIKGLLLTH